VTALATVGSESWVEFVVEEPEPLVIAYGPAKDVTFWMHGPWRLWTWLSGDASYWLNVYRAGLSIPIVRERHHSERDAAAAALRWSTTGLGGQRWPSLSRSPLSRVA
jgi:hypothetical protein